MSHPYAKHYDNGPVEPIIKHHGTPAVVVIANAPTYQMARLGDEAPTFSAGMWSEGMALFWKLFHGQHYEPIPYVINFACEYAPPGDRPPSKAAIDYSRRRLLDFLERKYPLARRVIFGQIGLDAVGIERKINDVEYSWLFHGKNLFLCLPDPQEIVNNPFHYRNFAWAVETIFYRTVPILHKPEVDYELIESLPRAEQVLFDKLRGTVCVDLETADPEGISNFDHTRAKITCISLCGDDGFAYIIPQHIVYHRHFQEIFQQFWAREDVEVVMHNGKFDNQIIITHLGVPYRLDHDTMLIAAAINEQGWSRRGGGDHTGGAAGRGLKKLARIYLGVDDYADVSYNPTNNDEWERLYYYAAVDTVVGRQLFFRLSEELRFADVPQAEVEALTDLYHLYLRTSRTLCLTELNGVRFDVDTAQAVGERLRNEEDELELAMNKVAGRSEANTYINPRSPKQLQDVLYGGAPWKCRKQRSRDGKVTTDSGAIEALVYDPRTPEDARWFLAFLAQYRKVNKLRSTYIDSPLKLLDKNGRLSSSYRIAGTVTGRLSSSDPNLQNIPSRGPLAKLIKQLYIPNAGHYLGEADLSQAELRVLAVLSGDEGMIETYREGGDIHTSTALATWEEARAAYEAGDKATFKVYRTIAKTINFGLIYGMEASTLAEATGRTVEEAALWMEKFFKARPRVKEYMAAEVEQGFTEGTLWSPMGHRRVLGYVPPDQKGRVAMRNHVMNCRIQGTAGLLTLEAGNRIASEYEQRGWLRWPIGTLQPVSNAAELKLTVHDSWIISARPDVFVEAMEIANHHLSTVAEDYLGAVVPFTSDGEWGTTWANCSKPMEEFPFKKEVATTCV